MISMLENDKLFPYLSGFLSALLSVSGLNAALFGENDAETARENCRISVA